MLPVDLGERPFVLETLIFWERVRMLAQKGLKATGGPMGEAGEVFGFAGLGKHSPCAML